MQTALTGLATTGSSVSLDRPNERTLQASELPALRIYDNGESANNYGFLDGADVYERHLNVTVEAAVKQVGTYSATLRTIAVEVETALGGHLTVTGKLVRPWYRGCEMSNSAEGDQPVGVRRMNFELVIYTAANAPNTLL